MPQQIQESTPPGKKNYITWLAMKHLAFEVESLYFLWKVTRGFSSNRQVLCPRVHHLDFLESGPLAFRHSLRAKLKDLQRSEHELQEPGTCWLFLCLKSEKNLEEFGGKQGVIHVVCVCVLFCFTSNFLCAWCWVLQVWGEFCMNLLFPAGNASVKSGSHFGIMTLPILDGSNDARMW